MEDSGDKLAIKKRSNIIYLEVGVYYLIIALSLSAVFYLASHDFRVWHSFIYLLSFLVIGWSQFSLSNALHEALHKNFGKVHNEFLAAILTAYPIGFTMNYRETHWDHHRNFGNKETDPDYNGYCNFPQTKKQLIMRLLYNISGFGAIKQFLKENTSKEKSGTEENSDKGGLMKLAIVQLIILGMFIYSFRSIHVLAGVFAYGLFWIGPLVTVAKFCSTTRLLCEHGSPQNKLVYRTITGNFFQTNLLGAFKFNYHGEHHIKPYIPYTKLKEAKETMELTIKNKDIAYEEYPNGYFSLLMKWFKELPTN